MAKRQKRWIYSSPKPPKAKVPDTLKAEVAEKANQLVEQELKPRYIKKPPKGNEFNYILDLYTRWYRNYFYFCAKYHCPGPNAISPFFEARFVRMEYIGDYRFNLAYMRHTGEWWEIMKGLIVDECLDAVRDGGLLSP